MNRIPYKKHKRNDFSLGHVRTPNLRAPWCWTSQPPEMWEININCLSHQVHGMLSYILDELRQTLWNRSYAHCQMRKWRMGSRPPGQCYWKCGPWMSASPEKLLELQSHRSHFRPAESESRKEGTSNLQFNKFCRHPLKLENHYSIAVFPEVWYDFPWGYDTFATWMNFLKI